MQPAYVPPINTAVNMRIQDLIKKNNKSIQQHLHVNIFFSLFKKKILEKVETKGFFEKNTEQRILRVVPNWDAIF